MPSNWKMQLRAFKRSIGRNPLVFHAYQFAFRVILNPMNKGQRLKSARAYLQWYLVQRPRNKTVTVEFANGMKSQVHADSDSGVSHLFDGGFDYQETRFLREELRQGDFIIDAGCNVGNRSIELADIIGGALLIDANRNCLSRARDNLQLNNLPLDSFHLLHSAIGASSGTIQFPDDSGTSCQNAISNGTENTVDVPMTTLDQALEELGNPPVAFLKTDLEGYDLDGLRGAAGLLQSDTLRLVLFERWPSTPLDGYLEFLHGQGWEVFALDRKGQLTSDITVIEQSNNLIALPTGERLNAA